MPLQNICTTIFFYFICFCFVLLSTMSDSMLYEFILTCFSVLVSRQLKDHGKWWGSRTRKRTRWRSWKRKRRFMSWTIMGNCMVLDSNFPRMASWIFCCMVVYIFAAIWCLYRSHQGCMWSFTQDRTATSHMCWEHDSNETTVWITLKYHQPVNFSLSNQFNYSQ